MTIRRDVAPVWNPGVEFYRIERERREGDRMSTELVGQFYLDPAARTGKRGGAWMDDVRARWLRPDNGALQTPVAHLVCNFAEGVDGKPPLLTHDDVITLFHEFGHGLHHMLTRVNERDVSGISGVEWDAVELPSQFMENFCWEWDVLRHMTAHVDTGAPLPRELFDKMLAAKNFQSGLATLRQIEFALFDMLLHTEHDPAQDFMPLLAKVRQEVAVIQPPAFSRTAHTFSHIFSGGYAAGYYSYKWAEVLSADAYAAFEETAGKNGLPSIETGRKYRQAILEAGGSRPAMESFKAFRGREPTLDALLAPPGHGLKLATTNWSRYRWFLPAPLACWDCSPPPHSAETMQMRNRFTASSARTAGSPFRTSRPPDAKGKANAAPVVPPSGAGSGQTASLPIELRRCGQPLPGHLVHGTRLRPLRRGPRHAVSPRRSLHREDSDDQRGHRGPQAAGGRILGPVPDHRRAAAQGLLRSRMDAVPGRGRLPEDLPAAGELPPTAGNSRWWPSSSSRRRRLRAAGGTGRGTGSRGARPVQPPPENPAGIRF